MNKIIKKEELYSFDHWWVKWTHTFSFNNYYDPNNMNFGNLIVFNDDYIEANSWFPMHPHANAEILTIMLEWTLTHTDTLWNKEDIKNSEIQTMTAGTWLFHSESNETNYQTHSYQIWFKTNKLDSKPSYKNHKINLEENKLNLLVSWDKNKSAWFLNADVEVYRWIYNKESTFEYEIKKWRWLFLYMTKWDINIDWKEITKKDHIRYTKEWIYSIKTKENSDFMLIDVEI